MQSRIAWRVILALAAIKFAVHLYASGSYGYFRDELYFIACGRHLDWGYVDHPPLVALYARIGEWLGSSLRAFRLLATIAGAAHVLLTGILTARLGGNRIAQALACAAVLCSPIYLGIDSILSMNVFEHLFWLGCILVIVEIANGASEKWWLAFGVLAGLGLQNKHSMLFLGFAVAVALLLTPLRRSLAKPWIYLGGALALLIFLPNVLWQIQHDFPTLELLHNVKESGKNIVLAPIPFVIQQVMMLNPFYAPLWIAGLVFLFANTRYRVLAWIYVVVLVTFIALEAKDYYVAPIYPMLFAAGAIWCSTRRWRVGTAFALIVIGALIAVPLSLPLLSPEQYLAYQRALGRKPSRTEVSHTSELPQLFSDQLGWEEMVREIARYYNSLPPDVRKKTAIYTANYGEAGAIDFYGPKVRTAARDQRTSELLSVGNARCDRGVGDPHRTEGGSGDVAIAGGRRQAVPPVWDARGKRADLSRPRLEEIPRRGLAAREALALKKKAAGIAPAASSHSINDLHRAGTRRDILCRPTPRRDRSPSCRRGHTPSR